MTTKTIWVRADLPGEYEERKSIVSSALEAGFSNVMIREEDAALKRLGRFEALAVRDDAVMAGDETIGRIVTISGPSDLEKASALRDRVRYLIIRARDWKVIPLENLIAELQGSETKLLAAASTPEEAKLFFETMLEVNYAQLRSGTVELFGKKVKTSSLSSYYKARVIAERLKKMIDDKEFTLNAPAVPLPTERAQKPLEVCSREEVL